MANKWSISSEPSVIGASIDENGNAVFPRNKTMLSHFMPEWEHVKQLNIYK